MGLEDWLGDEGSDLGEYEPLGLDDGPKGLPQVDSQRMNRE